jgi:hypothetical protein
MKLLRRDRGAGLSFGRCRRDVRGMQPNSDTHGRECGTKTGNDMPMNDWRRPGDATPFSEQDETSQIHEQKHERADTHLGGGIAAEHRRQKVHLNPPSEHAVSDRGTAHVLQREARIHCDPAHIRLFFCRTPRQYQFAMSATLCTSSWPSPEVQGLSLRLCFDSRFKTRCPRRSSDQVRDGHDGSVTVA